MRSLIAVSMLLLVSIPLACGKKGPATPNQPTRTPTVSVTPTSSMTPTASSTNTATASPSPTPTATSTATDSTTPTPSATLTGTATLSPSPTATLTATATVTATPTATLTPTPSVTPLPTPWVQPTFAIPGSPVTITDPQGRIEPGDLCLFYAEGQTPDAGTEMLDAIVTTTTVTGTVPTTMAPGNYSIAVRPSRDEPSRFTDLSFEVGL